MAGLQSEAEWSALEDRLGVRMRERRFYEEAFVHASHVYETGAVAWHSNERLEFLGDAVVQLAISQHLFHALPRSREGELTRLRSALVRAETLAAAAARLELGRFVVLGRGEEQSGGREREGLLADLFEAVTAAIYLDQGWEAAQAFVLRALAAELREPQSTSNPKASLQERLQARGPVTIEYRTVASEGPDHDKRFTVEVCVDGAAWGRGKGKTKRAAAQAAARQALLRLDANP